MLGNLTLSLTLLGLVACTSYQQQGALVGGLAGAGLGAIFGDDHQDAVAGAAIGAGLGAAGAAAHENTRRQGLQSDYDRRRFQGQGRPPQQSSQNYPTAQRTTTPGQVLSPYPPHNRIDVSGYGRGQLVRDPQTGEIFRVP
jgi:hypothetical protein